MYYDDSEFQKTAKNLLHEYRVEGPTFSISAASLVESLERLGIPIFLCGGTVRDIVLGDKPNDIDLIAKTDINQLLGATHRLLPPNAVSIFNQSLGLLRLGAGESYIDINMFRDIRSADNATSLAQVKWSYSGSPDSDAETTDFTVNAMYWRSDEGLLDPLGGIKHCERRLLVISASPHKASIDPKLALRMARFAALGFRPDEAALAFFRQRIDGDVAKYGNILPSYLHELTRGSNSCKQGIIDFAYANGASPKTLSLLADAAAVEALEARPYAATNLASPLAT